MLDRFGAPQLVKNPWANADGIDPWIIECTNQVGRRETPRQPSQPEGDRRSMPDPWKHGLY